MFHHLCNLKIKSLILLFFFYLLILVSAQFVSLVDCKSENYLIFTLKKRDDFSRIT